MTLLSCAVTITIIIMLSVFIARIIILRVFIVSITTPPWAGEQLLVARVAIVELILSLVSVIISKR